MLTVLPVLLSFWLAVTADVIVVASLAGDVIDGDVMTGVVMGAVMAEVMPATAERRWAGLWAGEGPTGRPRRALVVRRREGRGQGRGGMGHGKEGDSGRGAPEGAWEVGRKGDAWRDSMGEGPVSGGGGGKRK